MFPWNIDPNLTTPSAAAAGLNVAAATPTTIINVDEGILVLQLLFLGEKKILGPAIGTAYAQANQWCDYRSSQHHEWTNPLHTAWDSEPRCGANVLGGERKGRL
jgi:hypothetical protein